MGARTLLLTLNLDHVARMSCNPAIGGLAKGQVVREVDALGGLMGRVTDRAGIQFRMLNTGKGPAVRAPRAQADRQLYTTEMRRILEEAPNLVMRQGVVEEIEVAAGRVTGIRCMDGSGCAARAVVITTGTFMRGLIHVGQAQYPGGRLGEPPAVGVSKSLASLGFELGRLKTGTPPRVNGLTVRLADLEKQGGDDPPKPFSYSTERLDRPQLPCYVTYTNSKTHAIIRDNLDRAPLYTGQIKATGPRYCPSIEDKIVRFSEKDRHQLFLEPEGLNTHEMYANGIPTSLPVDVQEEMVHSIEGMEEARIVRYGYAIEYDFLPPTQLWPSLETKRVGGLFSAGQINGTSGYEEAAGQGIMAGINAALSLCGKEPLVLRRDEAYIGVLIDDLVTKGTQEPYRLFTSRAEHRLLLRQDNADRRLMGHGFRLGMVSAATHARLIEKERVVSEALAFLASARSGGHTLLEVMRRPEMDWGRVVALSPELARRGITPDAAEQVEIEAKYAGYVERQQRQAAKLKDLEAWATPADLDYDSVHELSNEARQKLKAVRPMTLAQASRISGVSPADISALMVFLESRRRGRAARPEASDTSDRSDKSGR